jgi:Ca2+-binding RTX toxin-like protein
VNDVTTGDVSISDTTPALNQLLTASNTFADPDGINSVTYQWQSSSDGGGTWNNIVGATNPTFLTTSAQVGQQLRSLATVTDPFGTTQVASTATAAVGEFNEIFGTAATETLNGTSLRDRITGNGGNDNLNGGVGNDELIGSTGSDRLDGGTGSDLMSGGAGNDLYYVESAGDTVTEGLNAGTDTVYTYINYSLTDNVENVTILASGPTGGVSVTGNALNNGLGSGAGDDILNGLGGTDTVTYALVSSGVTANLSTGTSAGGGGVDTFISIENLTGSVFADTLTGDNLANTLGGSGGNDTLFGLGGNDTLDGGTGADAMFGGQGNDVYFVDNAGDSANEDAGAGTDTVFTYANHTLGANIENLTIMTGTGVSVSGNTLNNSLASGAGNDVLNGQGGGDTVSYVLASGGVTASLAAGSSSGAAGVDTLISIENLSGSNFNDTLVGDTGVNTLSGAAGADRLDGGAGNDVLTGGTGNDAFVFSALGFGADRVTDFDAVNDANGFDLLDISGLGITAANFGTQVLIVDVGADTLVSFAGGFVRLTGVADATTVDVNDFLLA